VEKESKAEGLSPDQQATIAHTELKKLAEKTPVKIKNDEELKEATELLGHIKRTAKNTKAIKDPVVKGLRAQITAINGWFKPAEEAATAAERDIKAAIVEYHDRVARRAEKSAERIEEKVDKGEMDLQTGISKLSNIKQADNVTRTDAGTSQIRIVKKVKITNAGALPAHYFLRPRVLEALRMEVHEDVIRQKKPLPAGAEIYEEKGVAINA
jgi:hypothetical protein